MTDKRIKVRTSITIDPELLRAVRTETTSSVSAYVEKAIVFYRKSGAPVVEDEVVSNVL